MQKAVYLKKAPKLKAYRAPNTVTKHFVGKRRKLASFFILGGIVLVTAYFLPQTGVFTPSGDHIINPVPLSALASSVASNNEKIDKLASPGSFIPQEPAAAQTDKTPFYISIPTLGLQHIKVTPNVDGNNFTEYEKTLENSTAHLKGTPLPGQPGNTFIYGHSSPIWFHDLYPNSYQGIFTPLFQLKIGDTISISFSGNTLQYVVEGISTIDPKDLSQIQNTDTVNTLTLMTCSPPGVGAHRLVIKALQIS